MRTQYHTTTGPITARVHNPGGDIAVHADPATDIAYVAAGGVCGRMLMDQALHCGVQIPLGTAFTAALATRAEMGR